MKSFREKIFRVFPFSYMADLILKKLEIDKIFVQFCSVFYASPLKILTKFFHIL